MGSTVVGAAVPFADLAAAVLASPPRLGPVRWVSVDGRSGTGKTTFAVRFAGALRAVGATVATVRVDDLLDGWGDMATYWPRLEYAVLDPLRRGVDAGYRGYDWTVGRFGDVMTPVPVPEVLVLDGVTSARAAARPELTLSVCCVVADPALRLSRVLARDGQTLRPHLVRWMAQEDAHFVADGTESAADVLVDGAPTVEYEPDTEYVSLRER